MLFRNEDDSSIGGFYRAISCQCPRLVVQGRGHVKIEPPEGSLEVDPKRDKFKRLRKKNKCSYRVLV